MSTLSLIGPDHRRAILAAAESFLDGTIERDFPIGGDGPWAITLNFSASTRSGRRCGRTWTVTPEALVQGAGDMLTTLEERAKHDIVRVVEAEGDVVRQFDRASAEIVTLGGRGMPIVPGGTPEPGVRPEGVT